MVHKCFSSMFSSYPLVTVQHLKYPVSTYYADRELDPQLAENSIASYTRSQWRPSSLQHNYYSWNLNKAYFVGIYIAREKMLPCGKCCFWLPRAQEHVGSDIKSVHCKEREGRGKYVILSYLACNYHNELVFVYITENIFLNTVQNACVFHY